MILGASRITAIVYAKKALHHRDRKELEQMENSMMELEAVIGIWAKGGKKRYETPKGGFTEGRIKAMELWSREPS